MKKYFVVFKTSWQNTLEYRFNFFLGRLRVIIVLVLFYYVWQSVTYSQQRFAGYSVPELFTYAVLSIDVLRSLIFGAQSRKMASEINDGSFSQYLLKPINHFWFVFARELAERSIYFITSFLELFVFIFIVKVPFVWQTNIALLSAFIFSCLLSLFLYFILSYMISLIAFWSREAMGPRFLYEWFLEFSSGAYFPLDIVPKIFFSALQFLPFMYLVYLPVTIYLGRMDWEEILVNVMIQGIWVLGAGILAYIVWNKGLRRYTGEGM